MIPFKQVTLEDKDWIDKLCKEEDSRSADHNFTNIFVWDDSFMQKVAEVHGCLAIRLGYEDHPFYAYPVGAGDTKAAILALKEDSASHGVPLRLRGITAPHIGALEAMFPGEFQLTNDRFVYDYIYSAEKLASLGGKKLHAKRNHINRFIENNPDWSFEPVTAENIGQCAAFNEEWLALNGGDDPSEYEDEVLALRRTFANYEYLGLEGGILRAGGKTIAYTIGEKTGSDTYDVHFEKAHYDIQGSYAMINREFVRYVTEKHPEIKYINREDDMGLENLRKAKESYYPEFMVEKHTAVWSD